MRYLKKIRFHIWALIIAVSLGITTVSPFLYVRWQLGSEFKGIDAQFANDKLFYMARIQDVIDGHSLLSNAYL